MIVVLLQPETIKAVTIINSIPRQFFKVNQHFLYEMYLYDNFSIEGSRYKKVTPRYEPVLPLRFLKLDRLVLALDSLLRQFPRKL